MTTKSGSLTLLIAALTVLAQGCNKGGSNTASGGGSSNGAESDSAVAVGVASGAAAQSSGQNVGLFNAPPSFFDLCPSAFASSACPTYVAPQGATCSGQTMTLAYAACSFGTSTATWSGGEVLTFGGTAVCGTTTLPLINNGDTLTRTFSGTIPLNTATKRTASSTAIVSLDTTTLSGYALSASGGIVTTGNGTGHSIVINGVHLVSSLWDHTVTTDASAPLVVTNPGANRVIQSGTILIQHNLALYTGQVVFNNVSYNATSCFPQSGSVQTTFTGSTSGSETLTFNGGGSATLTNSRGVNTTFTMVHCF